MIDLEVLNRVRSAVCAIGLLQVTGEAAGKYIVRPVLEVFGTGFLVLDSTVMTNRHVIEGILEQQESRSIPDNRRYLMFTFPAGRALAAAFCRWTKHKVVTIPEFDVGFIDFKRVQGEPGFDQCRPLQFAPAKSVYVGKPVAALGYPYGTDMLERDGRIYRFGAILQQGHVSAVAPFDGAANLSDIMLDLRVGPGMSGSPVFYPEDGSVAGMIYATWEATTGVAVPTDPTWVKAWLMLREFDTVPNKIMQMIKSMLYPTPSQRRPD